MKKQSWLYLAVLFFYGIVQAQNKISDGIIDETKIATKISISQNGYGGTYPTNTLYSLVFGVESDGSTLAKVPILKSFKYDNLVYFPYLKGNKPYENIKIKRVNSVDITSPKKFTGFFEYSNAINSNPRHFRAEYTDSLEILINSYTLNRGVDNVFSNKGSTANNIERIDLIQNSGMEVPTGVSLGKIGVLIVERGGNDKYKLAAITNISNGEVSELGILVNRENSNFGSLGKSVVSTVFMSSNTPISTDPIKPSQNINEQIISGDFIDLKTLGLTPGQVIYGIALFPDDLKDNHDFIGLTNVPTDTDETYGGLDLMGGGGFAIVSTTAIVDISGNVYRDMINNKIVDGIGIGNIKGTQLYAYVINSFDNVIFKEAVKADGSYSFLQKLVDTSEDYSVIIDSRNLNINDKLSSPYQLPIGWIATGKFYGIDNGLEPGNDTNADLKVPIRFSMTKTKISNVNFGINYHCTKPGDFSAIGKPTNNGITNQTKLSNWPTDVSNGFLALESKVDGLVISRVQSSSSIIKPKKGMLIFDISDKCVKLYNGNIWNCIQKSCND